MPFNRPIRPEFASFTVAAFFVTVLNVAFWHRLYTAVAPRSAYEFLFIVAVFVVALCLLTLLFRLLAGRRLFKPAVTLFLLPGSAAAYFINEYGVVIDAGMVTNILETNQAEAADLLTTKLAIYVLVLGALPSLLLWACRIAYRPFWPDLWFKARAVLVAAVVVALTGLPFTQNIASVFRQHRILLDAFVPLNFVSAVAEHGRKRLRSLPHAVASIAEDAHKTAAWSARHRRSLTVIVVGETARAKNFSLNGYARETNPMLSTVPGLISFQRAYSCGTDTAQSLPCMFSALGQAGFAIERAAKQEGLLDILQRAGFSVLWRENQGG